MDRRSATRKSKPVRLVSRLRIEPLEARRLLAGLEVSVFVDSDGSRQFDALTEAPAPNRLVYIDLDGSGDHQPHEPLQVTDETGRAFFADLAEGDYQIGLLTNPESQRQSNHIAVSGVAERTGDTAATILADRSFSHFWSVDVHGMGRPHDSESGASEDAVDFGGPISRPLRVGEERFLFVAHTDEQGDQLIEFNVRTGEQLARPIAGLAEGGRVLALAEQHLPNGTTDLVALVDAGQETSIQWLATDPVQATVSERQLAAGAIDVAIAAGGAHVATLHAQGEHGSVVRLHVGETATTAATRIMSLELDGLPQALQYSADGQFLFVTFVDGGVAVLNPADSGLTLAAWLSNAAGPVVADAQDGRLLTASAQQPQRVIVWDTTTWQPVARSYLPENSVGGLRQVMTDYHGDRAMLLTDAGMYTVDLAMPEPAAVVVQESSAARVQFGVRRTGANTLPDVEAFPELSIFEDEPFELPLTSEVLQDAEGDRLWFSVATAPAHGQLVRTADGRWEYTSDKDYHGPDGAVVRVYDGLDVAELNLAWQVAAVNDPPQAILLQIPRVSEDTEIGSQVGFLSVVDPDHGAEYRITTSDPRFSVVGGRVYFVEGSLDFETEPTVTFDVLATDVSQPSFRLLTTAQIEVTDADEPPQQLLLSHRSVVENERGAVVGMLRVVDPDAGSEYAFAVDDERFVVDEEGRLRLADSVALDFEEQAALSLRITANEVGGAGSVSKRFEIDVLDGNDQPTSIVLTDLSVAYETDGAVVGKISVADQDGDAYSYLTSDPRFTVREGVLRLVDGVALENSDAHVPLTIEATSARGERITHVFPLVVVPPPAPHQNPEQPTDVNRDGVTSPLDVLLLVNAINSGGGGVLPTPGEGTGEPPPTSPDVNGDGSLTPIDVLLIVNELNGQRSGEGGEGEFGGLTGATDWSDLERQRRRNSELDTELETLLEQLAQTRPQRG